MADYFTWNNRAWFHSIGVQYRIKWEGQQCDTGDDQTTGADPLKLLTHGIILDFIVSIYLLTGNEELFS